MLGRFVCAALAAGFLAQGVAGPRPGTYRIEILRVRLHRYHVKSVCAGQLSLCP